MANVNFFPKWAFERPLPKPFDCYSGRDAIFKGISSKYCIQPRKQATLHSATLQAVFTYMDLENPPAGKAEEELGAIGSQANNFTLAEYPSRTGLLHVVVYNRMTGKFIAGKYEKPLDLDSKPEPYQFKKAEDSGSALYFALMPAFLSDDEFNEKYQELKQHRDDGFPDLSKAAETAALLCDNVYRRIRYRVSRILWSHTAKLQQIHAIWNSSTIHKSWNTLMKPERQIASDYQMVLW